MAYLKKLQRQNTVTRSVFFANSTLSCILRLGVAGGTGKLCWKKIHHVFGEISFECKEAHPIEV